MSYSTLRAVGLTIFSVLMFSTVCEPNQYTSSFENKNHNMTEDTKSKTIERSAIYLTRASRSLEEGYIVEANELAQKGIDILEKHYLSENIILTIRG